MKLFKILATLVLLTLPFVSVIPAQAEEKNCEFCTAIESGVGSLPGKPTSCIVVIEAPTFGGEVALDVRRADGASIWGKPRIIKNVAPGTFVYRIGCSQIASPTDQIYLCVDGRKGGDGYTWHSSRFRAEGSLDEAFKTRHLRMCLTGKGCPKWHGD